MGELPKSLHELVTSSKLYLKAKADGFHRN